MPLFVDPFITIRLVEPREMNISYSSVFLSYLEIGSSLKVPNMGVMKKVGKCGILSPSFPLPLLRRTELVRFCDGKGNFVDQS